MAKVTVADGRVFTLPILQAGIMGHPGSGKSKFCASMPKPLRVMATDPMMKMQPYFDEGVVDDEIYKGIHGQPVRLVRDFTGKLIIQIDCFFDTTPETPTAYDSFGTVLRGLPAEIAEGRWASIAIDSWSGLEDLGLSRRTAGPMKVDNKDGRGAYNFVKDDLRQLLSMHIIHALAATNLGITFHISEKMQEESGTMLFGIDAIGKLPNMLGRVIAERYRSEASPNGMDRVLHTKPDGRFHISTLIDAPSPCKNEFNALFSNWIARRVAQDDAARKAAAEAAKSATVNPAADDEVTVIVAQPAA